MAKIEHICPFCKKTFLDYKCKNRVFCSRECSMSWRMKHELIREKHPRWKGGVTKSNLEFFCKWCGKQYYRSMNAVKQNQSNFCSNKCTGHYYHSENGKNWKGGKSQQWSRYRNTMSQKRRDKIKEFYNYTCQECGFIGKKTVDYSKQVSVHHIDLNSLNDSDENLTVLCKSCHGKKHIHSLLK